MAISLNSIVSFNSPLRARYQHVSRSSATTARTLTLSASSLQMYDLRRRVKERRWILPLSVADSDRIATDTSDVGLGGAERSASDDGSSTISPPSSDSLGVNSQIQSSVGGKSRSQEGPNGSMASPDIDQEASLSPNKQPKRSPLTPRERLRAGRVLSRYTETKTSKSAMGTTVLDALRESDKGKKRSRLPEAPTNLLDDSKRGMPKKGLTFDFPGGSDLFIIAFSFVFISTVMFATTFVVWKVGAIHFNEY